MTADTTPDPVTAALEEMRERSAKAMLGFSSNPGTYIDSANDVPSLLAAVEAVLKLADTWAAGRPGEIGPGFNATRACGRRIREAITRALTGKEAAP